MKECFLQGVEIILKVFHASVINYDSSSIAQKFIKRSSEYMCTFIMIWFLCHFASVLQYFFFKKNLFLGGNVTDI